MTRRGGRAAVWLGIDPAPGLGLALWAFVFGATGASAQGGEVHGENAVFARHGVTLTWAVLRAPVEDEAQVVLRIVVAPGIYTVVDVDAVDPFGGGRRAVLTGQPLTRAPLDVRSPRALFADFPRREVRLYRTDDDHRAGRLALTIYYLGVPDTTPEFTSEAAMAAYLRGQACQSGQC